ncbi:MAG TPA: ankyrin repeat domain-containing protein [Pyrinomonadaceae bacterium]|nr:ankyrin repeat domain-containing protein [Pyrinomonadaceae bacterium]
MSYSLPLTNAVTRGDEQAVSAILANGADVNETTGGGQTALILAVIFGHTNLVKLLMRAGADPQLRDNLGLNAIEWAQRRGLTEAVAILKNSHGESTPPRKIVIPLAEPPPKVAAKEPPPPKLEEEKESASEADKSVRWIAGFKQRLHEQELRRLNRNEPSVEPTPPLMSTEAPAVVTEPPKAPEPEPTPEPPRSVIAPPRILIPAPTTPTKSSTRKRCPQCNAIYNSDLVAYCAHHIVPLVPADDPIISEPPRSNVPLFWILLIVTLAGSIVLGSLITTYIYRSRQAAAARTAAQQTRPLQKGTPELGGELVGKAVSLPEAECPLKGTQPVAGTVTVRVMVDQNGQVYWARGAGGDWLMRGAATEAAMKSTFSPEKLRGRQTEGTIIYTFKP